VLAPLVSAARYKLHRALANRRPSLAFVALLALAGAAESSAQIESCTRLSDDRERLACFDREMAAQMARQGRTEGTKAAVATTATKPETGSPKLTEEQKMGLSSARIEQLEKPPGSAPPPKELTVTIQSIARDGSARQVFTLTNGQIWRQVEVDASFAVHAGDSVVISRAMLGSYIMSFGKHLNTRVSRVH
jgi:hypothetical protein